MGGMVTNNAGGHITGGSTGVYVKYRAAGTVTNSGSIAGTATSSTGVDLAGGGTLTNNVGGSITGGNFGVFVGSTSTLATFVDDRHDLEQWRHIRRQIRWRRLSQKVARSPTSRAEPSRAAATASM